MEPTRFLAPSAKAKRARGQRLALGRLSRAGAQAAAGRGGLRREAARGLNG